MKELLDKLSSYNIFNYLLPGVIFVVLLEKITSINLLQEDFIIGAFFYYFIGLIISRVGSIFIEPLLRKCKFLIFSDYRDFINASKEDPKLETLSEVNNMYRTFCTLFIFLIFGVLYSSYLKDLDFVKSYGNTILVIIFFVLFLFSYRKQTSFITERIGAYKSRAE